MTLPNIHIPGILVLQDGTEFSGFLFGALSSAEKIQSNLIGSGEVVFNTSMTGYQEILTDPSYYGQMVCMTTAHIGNTGVNQEDEESNRLWCSGFLVREFNSDFSSNWRARPQENLDQYLKRHQIPGLYGVDTRALTRYLRSKGVIQGLILPLSEKDLAPQLFRTLPSFEGRDLMSEVSTPKPYLWKAEQNQNPIRVVAIDYGIKTNLLRSLSQLGCEIQVVPAKSTAKEILSLRPAGVFLSNGPGDPKVATYAIQTVEGLLGKVPIFGVCMGHQILALALGAKTYKLKFGHRGGNQPVLNTQTDRVEISSHNHGYAVDGSSLPTGVTVTHMNLNDKTVEGISAPHLSAFSVQYHPEACPGPHDSMALFENFIQMVRKNVSKIS